MRYVAVLAVLAASVITRVYSAPQGAPRPSNPVEFVRDVRPILQKHCYDCHGPDKQMNGFRLDRRRDAMRGGTIPVIAPGSAMSSRLYLRLIGDRYGQRMPRESDPLTTQQIDTIKTWIDQGAAWPDAASGDVDLRPPDPVAMKAFAALRGGNRAAFLSSMGGNAKLSELRGPGGATPLMMAALYGDTALVKALLDEGARPNVADDAGATALMWALTDLEKTRLLVERGADVNARSDDGRSPVIIAASIRGNRDVVALLLDRGANPSAQAPGLVGPVTPLAEAAKQGDEAIVRLLIDRGADVGRAGFLAFALAMRARCDGCVAALSPKLPPSVFTPTMALAAPPLGPALATVPMLERGADANLRTPTGYPMLVLAAASEAQPVEAVKALLAHGADLRATGPDGETALDVARRHGTTPVVDALVQAGATATAPATPSFTYAPASSPRAAVLRSLPLLQRSDEVFMRKAGCASCHNNSQTAETVALARARGLAVDETIAKRQLEKIAAYVEDWRERNLQLQGIPGDHDTMSALLNGLAAEHQTATPATDAMARFVRLQQIADGSWRVFAHRPPIEAGNVKVTAESMRALQAYAPGAERDAADAAIARARDWLARTEPNGVQERAYHLFGLHWSHAGAAAVNASAQALVGMQRADGGWSQLPTLESDAYATGEALVALLESGARRPDDPAITRGLQFLLKTQLADGSWFVARRTIPVQPYFDAGFPHGKDQFVSAAATNWATQALIYASAKSGT